MLDKTIAESAAAHPDRQAIAVEDRSWSYAAFQENIELISAKLEAGLSPRPTLAVLYQLHPFDAWSAMIALRRAGLDTAATDNAAHLDEPFFANALIVASRQKLDERRCVDLADRTVGAPAERIGGGAHHLASSGATGGLKILRMDPDAEPEVAAARAALFGFSRSTRFHIGGFGLWTAAGYKFPLAVWSAGGAVVIDRRTDFADRLEAYEVDQAFMLPDQLSACAMRRRTGPIPGLRIITSGGFTAAETVALAAERVATRLTNIYTATEVNRTILVRDHAGDPTEFAWLDAAPGVEFGIFDEAGVAADTGALRIKLASGDCRAYAGGGSEEAFAEGWLHPGDMAERRADGRIRILGRADATVIVGGQKKAAAPFERALREKLGVDACIFSGQLSTGEPCVALVLETAEPPDADQVISTLTGLPKGQLVTVTCLARFPRTTMGMNKIRRNALRRLVFEKLGMGG